MGAMSDFERRRIQNREAQRRFRQRHNLRKNANQALQNGVISEPANLNPTTARDQQQKQQSPSRSRRQSAPEKTNSPPRMIHDKLTDPFLSATTPPNSTSLFSTGFDHHCTVSGGGDTDIIYSPTLLDGLDFGNLHHDVHESCIHVHNQGGSEPGLMFPTSPSTILQVSPQDLDGSSSDSNTDHNILGGLMGSASASTHSNLDRLSFSTTHCESNSQGGNTTAPSASSPDKLAAADNSTSGWQNPLHMAAAKGHDRITRILLQHNTIDCNERDSDGFTPLMHATIGGYEDVVRSLLAHGAAVELVDGQHRRSALHWAIVHRREGVLRILLDQCGKEQTTHAIDVYDDEGRTPLHTAVDTGYDAGVQLLLELGANARYRTRKRERPSGSG